MKEKIVDLNFSNILDKKIIVTGDKGFKASWLIVALLNIGCKNIIGVGISNKNDIIYNKINSYCNYKHYDINIKNYNKIKDIFKKFEPDIIFHLAAQPLVLDSYLKPLETYKTNLIGTMNILESALNCKCKLVINVTTDKIYKNHESNEGYDEEDTIDGYDPYSASKACVEIMSKSFYESFLKHESIKLINVRSGNVIGGGDMSPNRIFTDIYNSYKCNNNLILRNPNGIRPYQHVLDVIFAYIYIASYYVTEDQSTNKGIFEAYNIAPDTNNEITNIDLAKKALTFFNQKTEIMAEKSNYHETKILKLKNFKIKKIISYFPLYSIDKAIQLTVQAYMELNDSNKFWNIMNKQIKEYWDEIKKNNH